MSGLTKREVRRGRSASVRGGIAPLPVMNEEVVAVTRVRGGRSRRARRRGVRADRGSPNDGSNQAAAPPLHPSPPTASTSTSQQQNLEDVVRHELMSFGDKIPHLINYGSEIDSDENDEDEDWLYPLLSRVSRNMVNTPFDPYEGDPVAFDQPTAGDPETASNPEIANNTETANNPETASDPTPDIDPPTATDKPWSWCDFEWKEFPTAPIPPESRRETFSESNVGPTTPLYDPYDIFVDIWDRKIMEHIASETNKYAQQVSIQMLRDQTIFLNSLIAHWQDTTVDELYVFFAVLLAMGIVSKSPVEQYWNDSRECFSTPGFSAYMSCNRFLVLDRFLHFNDNKDMCAQELDGSEARIFKLQPLLSHLNMKFQSMYTLRQNISIDESLLTWKGVQPFPSKAESLGIKSFEICEPQTGYLWRFEVHSQKKKSPAQQTEDPLQASAPSNVLRLIQGLEHKGHTLWMDSYYNSPCLARLLKCLGFDCVGTLRTNRKFVPQTLHELDRLDMRQGQLTGLTSGDVDVMVWRYRFRVAMISTYHGNGQLTVGGFTEPHLIFDYNVMMGGVDKKDRILASNPIEQKGTKVWYKTLFKRLLNVSVFNSCVISCHHRHTSSQEGRIHLDYREVLIKSLLSKHFNKKYYK